VSGAASAAQDEEMANAGANALSANTMAAVSYFEKAKVDTAFAQGAVLLNGDNRNYMVHASRREKAGQAEVHSNDTDVIHVLSGTATLVTGGKVVDGKNIAEDEIRGVAIDGGESRQIAQGDVIVVPNGVPHWFKEVKGPMTYYVVKVR
jgi:glc operon protein GlcG